MVECAFIKSDVCDTGYFASPVQLGVSNATVIIATIRGLRLELVPLQLCNRGVITQYFGC